MVGFSALSEETETQDSQDASKARSWIRTVVRQGAILVAGLVALQALFFLLLIVGQAVPDKPIVDNLAQSVDEGTYGPSGAADRMGGISDTFTECVVVGTGLGASEDSPFQRAIYMPRISNCESGGNQIAELAAGNDVVQGQYYKYWAGYTVITRPVLAVAGLEGLRIAAGAMLIGAIAFGIRMIAKRTSNWAAAALVAPLLLASNLMSTPSTSFSQALSISLIFVGTGIAAWGAGRSKFTMIGAVALGAALFCYVDLLTTPAIPWAFASAVVAGVLYSQTRNIRKAAVGGVLAAIVWPLSFAITWISRWLIAAAFLGWTEVKAFVQRNVEFRTAGEWDGIDTAFGRSTIENAYYWWEVVPTAKVVLLGAVAFAVCAVVLAIRRNSLSALVVVMVLALPALIIPIWYEALSNHSQIHAFFVYRSVPAAIGIGLFAAVVAAGSATRLASDKGRRASGIPSEPQKRVAQP